MKFISKVLPIFLILIISGFTTAEGQTTELRTFSGIEGIKLLGSGNVDIKIGDKEEIVIHAPADLMSYLITEMDDGTLLIGKRKKGWKNFRRINEKIRYDLVVMKINHIKVSGSGDIDAERLSGKNCAVKVSGSGNVDVGSISSDKLIVNVSGSGDINLLNVTSDILDVSINGSGNVETKGKIDEVDLTISGSGDFDGTNLNCRDASIDIYGSGNVELNVKNTLQAHISGSGDVIYDGNPQISTRSTGSGKVKHRNL